MKNSDDCIAILKDNKTTLNELKQFCLRFKQQNRIEENYPSFNRLWETIDPNAQQLTERLNAIDTETLICIKTAIMFGKTYSEFNDPSVEKSYSVLVENERLNNDNQNPDALQGYIISNRSHASEYIARTLFLLKI